jgi:Family of unknown function (DUF5682)
VVWICSAPNLPTRSKPQDLELEIKVDLRSEAGLLKSTLLHRLNLINVPWGKLLDAQAGRGTFREVWVIEWEPWYSVSLAEALVHEVTIEQAAANATLKKARDTTSITELASLIRCAAFRGQSRKKTQTRSGIGAAQLVCCLVVCPLRIPRNCRSSCAREGMHLNLPPAFDGQKMSLRLSEKRLCGTGANLGHPANLCWGESVRTGG